VYAVVFSWYLVRVSVRSGVLGVGVVMHVLHLLDERYVVLVPLLEGVGDLGKELFRCILSLNRVSRVREIPLSCAMCNMCCHSLSCCSLSSGSGSILLMKNRYAAILCSRG